MDDSAIACGEIIEETKTSPANYNEKKATYKTQNFYIGPPVSSQKGPMK